MASYQVFVFLLVAITCVNCMMQLFDGRNVSPGQQCRNRGSFGGVCRTSDPAERCLHLKCGETKRGDIPMAYDVGPALQGTSCGDNKICIGGQCTDDPDPPRKRLPITDFQYGCED